ncbi:MAG: hypothetical protein J6X71_02800 [Bacteroidales bacterium]|nr:hypothetical protein [Bacteroidales bacterium]
MKTRIYLTLAATAILLLPLSCEKEIEEQNPTPVSGKVSVSISATGEPEDKASLDFSQAQNVRWADDDLIAVFDGTAKNQFSIDAGTNSGASATFSGEVTAGYTDLYAVYPYSAAGSLSGSSLSVTVPASQTISASAPVDPAAIVSVGKVDAGTVEFKQVCGLLKFQIDTTNITKVILHGTNLAGTATVAATGVLSSVTAGESSIEISYSGGCFAEGRYFAAVLPGTTAANVFTVEFVEDTGLTYVKSVPKAVTVARKEGKAIGAYDDTFARIRHISNKAQLYDWGANMGKEHNVTVYLDADIDCASEPWDGEGTTFDGVFEGQNHKIYNLVVTFDGENTGFISRLMGMVKDLTVGSSNGSSWDGVSTITHNGSSSADADTRFLGLVGRMVDGSNMTGVNNYAAIVAAATDSRVYIGGLVGTIPEANSATLTNCKNYGSVTDNSTWTGGQTRMGGILGQCDGALTASGVENHGTITVGNNVTNFVGGLCGDLGGGSSVSGSKNYGTITFTDSGTSKTYLGGCFGSVRGSTISDCHNYGAITASRNAECWFGGIAGFFESGVSSLTDCVNHTGADLMVTSSVAKRVLMGGITGGCQYNGSGPFGVTLQDCKNEAAVTNSGCASDFGGIAGLFDNYLSSATILIQNCENTGAISSTVGNNTSMSRELRVGGIIGGTDPESAGCEQIYRSCINRGTVTVDGALKSGASVRVGGIVGNAYECTTIDKCKNFGNVGSVVGGSDAGSAVFTFGGILGYIQSRSASRYQQVTDCINTGTVSSVRNYNNQYLGGIVGGGTTDNNVYPQVNGCKNYGNISATRTTNTLVGGLCGYIKYTVANSANFGDVSGGSWNGAVVGDGNASAVVTTGIEVGDGVEVTGAANAGTKYSGGRTTYSFTTTSTAEKKWFSGWSDAPITVTVVDQETYSE